MSSNRRLLLSFPLLLIFCFFGESHVAAETYQWKDFHQPFRQTIVLFGMDKKITVVLPAEILKQHDQIPLVVQTFDLSKTVPWFFQINGQSLSPNYRLKGEKDQTVANQILFPKKYLKAGANRLEFTTYPTYYTWSPSGQIVELRFDLPGQKPAEKPQKKKTTAADQSFSVFQWKDFRQPFRQTIVLFGSDKEVTVLLPAEVLEQHDQLPLFIQTSDRRPGIPLFLQVNDQSLSQAYRLTQKGDSNVTSRILIAKKYFKPGTNRLRFTTYSTHYVTSTILGQIVELHFDLSQPQKQEASLAKKPAPPLIAPATAALRKDGRPPEITITSHDISRGIKPVVNQREMVVAGRASDASGVSEITVNGVHVAFGPAGNFASQVRLQKGENRVVVRAVDIYGNRAEQIFTVVKGKTTKRPVAAADQEGKFYALIIGNDDYKYLHNLKTAKKDARAVEAALHRNYGFQTQLMLDATRNDIIGAINHFRKTLKENDNFLVYYAGHGQFDATANKAYWLPVDARSDEDTNWIIADRITSNVRRFSSRHVLIVSDSCYSGTLTRKATAGLSSAHQRKRYLQKMQRKKSRTLLASGGNEPVSDTGGGGHSIFARAFLSGLTEMETDTFSAEELYYQYIKEMVAGSSDQTPEYDIIRNSGHEGGEFIFQKRQ